MTRHMKVYEACLAAFCCFLLLATMWVFLDISWSKVGDGDRLNAFLALVLGGIGSALGVVGYGISKRQGEIAEEQHRLMREQMERASRLSFRHRVARHEGNALDLRFAIFNEGNRAARGIYFHLLMPRAAVDGSSTDFRVPPSSSVEIDGIVDYSGYTPEPVFPDRGKHLCEMRIKDVSLTAPFEVRWQLSADDGLFPGKGQFGVFVVGPTGAVDVRIYAIGQMSLKM